MLSNAWLVLGLIGGVLALLAGVTWVAGLIGGLLVLASVVLQYVDSRPFRKEITPAAFTEFDGGWEYQETARRAGGKVNIAIFIRQGQRWEEVNADNGIGTKDRFWIALASAPTESFLVVAR